GMRMEPFNGLDHIISLDCFTVMVPSAFVGLSLYDFQNPKDALVSFNYRTTPTVASPRITTKTPVATNVAPQLVESGTTRGVGTKDSPIRVTEDTSVLFYLKAYPAPAFKSATFLGKTMLPNNSLEAHTGPKTFTESMIRCWPLSLYYRVQCEIVEHLEEGFYAVTLENEVDEITVYLQVDPKKSEGMYEGM
ncbi:hypothetical protein BaRGS_00016938, partial [Batillaria attramentaria]